VAIRPVVMLVAAEQQDDEQQDQDEAVTSGRFWVRRGSRV
jgi:hypothetical protein